MLDQCSLMLERVTLTQVVELVVQMLVDLARGAVFDQETAEDSETAHPEHLARQGHKNLSQIVTSYHPPL